MVGVDLMEQMANKESFYEEVTINQHNLSKKNHNCDTAPSKSDVIDVLTTQLVTPSSTQQNEENVENIYEVIPGDSLVQSCEKCPVNRSASFCCVHRNRSDSREDKSMQKENATSSNSAPSSPKHEREFKNYTPYAEIIQSNSVTDFMPSRPTRDSENAILRQDFSGNLAFLPNLRNIRKELTAVSQDLSLEREKRNPKAMPSLCTRESEQRPDLPQENSSRAASPKQSPNQSPRAKTPQGPIYVNVEFPLIDGGCNNSRRSSASSSSYTEQHSISSNDDSVFRDSEIPNYENLKDIGFPAPAVPSQTTPPVDIVYSDLDFHESNRTAKSKLGKSSSSPAESVYSTEEKSRSLPPQSSPRLPLRGRNLTDDSRPKSKSLGKLSGGALGFYVARFVRKAIVQRSNAKTLQATIHDAVCKTTVEQCISVNVEVTSDMMRISTNCPPWEVICSFGIENIGCIDLFEQDHTTLGVIVCSPEENAECYVIRSLDAQQIYRVIINAFNSPTSKAFKVPVSTPVGPESWLGDDDVTSFADIQYLGSLKVKKSYLLINQCITALLEKAHPRDFKCIYLEVQPNSIRLIDTKDNAVLGQHAIPWILLLGVYEHDKRLFGYIVSEAWQGEKTRMYCHAFRCSRITSSVAATEVIRLGCQASYTDRRESLRSRRRNSSMVSHSSRGSSESNEGSSLGGVYEPNPLVEEPEREEHGVKQQKPKTKSKLKRFSSMPHLILGSCKKDKEHKLDHVVDKGSHDRTRSMSSASTNDVIDSTWEIVEEKDYTFNATYLCSTIINPPLRAKHLRQCVKQYQRQQVKSLKRFGVEQPSSDVVLCISLDGVNMKNARTHKGGDGMFFPLSSVNHVMAHPEDPEYFAFATVVSGDSKHKCHLFKQTHVPTTQVIESFQCFM